MAKCIKKCKFIIIAIVLVLIGILLFAVIKKEEISKYIQNINKEETHIFSYVVYDNKDKEKIKCLLDFNSKNGIEYIQKPNGDILYCNGKNHISMDYYAKENSNDTFKIKEVGKDLISQELNINNETTQDTTIQINEITNIFGYKAFEINKKINIDKYDKVSYKIGENGEWVEGTKGSASDYDMLQNGLLNADKTVSIYAKIENTDFNQEVVVSKTLDNIDTNNENNNIESTSLIEAVKENEFNNGKYTIIANNETYNTKVYNINGNLELKIDTQLGVEEDVGKSDTYAQNMVILKVNGDLTIGENAKLTAYSSKDGYGGPKGMLIYCTGTITNYGKISMTARGAYAEGQNVYLLKNEDGSYEYVPADGANGGVGAGYSGTEYGSKGDDGYLRRTGGGRRRQQKWRCKLGWKWICRNVIQWRNWWWRKL